MVYLVRKVDSYVYRSAVGLMASWQIKYACTGKINLSTCVNGIPYINGAQEMAVHERIAFVT